MVPKVSIELLTPNSIMHTHQYTLKEIYALKEMQAETNIKISTVQKNIIPKKS